MNYVNPMSRVPIFQFVDREHGEDLVKSAELGYPVPRCVTFILIVPHGQRGDPMEFMADEFIARKKLESNSGRYDGSWVKEFETGLSLFRQGKTMSRSGTPIQLWERLLKTRREMLAPMFPTVEDLAAVPDSALGNIGLDGRVIRDLARGDIQAKKELSPIVKELADANETIRRQQEQITSLAKRLDAIDLLGTETPRAGRPRKVKEELD